MGFLHISLETEVHAVLKTWDEWIPIVREKYEKTQTFQNYGFLTYFMWRKNPFNSQIVGWVNSHITEKEWENTGNPHVLLLRFRVNENSCNPTVWECTNSYNMEIFCGKPYHLQMWFSEEIWEYFFPVHGK